MRNGLKKGGLGEGSAEERPENRRIRWGVCRPFTRVTTGLWSPLSHKGFGALALTSFSLVFENF